MILLLPGQKGMVLVLVVFLLAILSLLGIASSRNVAIDTAASSNQLSSVRSFYLAEAGLEKGEREAVRRMVDRDWYNFTPLLDGSDATTLDLPFGPSVPFGQGHFSVTVQNDPAESGSTTDRNRSVTIRSKGVSGTSTTMLEATIQVLTPPRLPGAVSVFGNFSLVSSGGMIHVSGHDHTMDYHNGSPDGLSSSRPGISLCGTSTAGITASTVRSMAKGFGDLSGSVEIDESSDAAIETIDDYVANLKKVTTNTLSCSGFNMIYLDGDLQVDCPSGKGILIASGNVEFAENSSWDGLIVVRGGLLTLRGTNDLKGGVVLETLTDTSGNERIAGIKIGEKGSVRLLYSRQALDAVSANLTGNHGKWRVLAWRRVH